MSNAPLLKNRFILATLTLLSASATQAHSLSTLQTPSEVESNETKKIILTIANNRDAELAVIRAIVNSRGELAGIEYGNRKNEAEAKYFSLPELNQSSGAVLEEDHSALILLGSIDSQFGGNLTFKYLYNGIFNTYHTCTVRLRKGLDNSWELGQSGVNEPILNATIIAGSIGINTLEGICQK